MTYQFKNITALVVESSEPMLSLVRDILITFGIGNVVPAYNIEKAFDLFCRTKPDLVLVDWLQEKASGLDLTRMIRTDPRSHNQFTPVIVMTGFSQKKRVIMARDSGISEFLVKPYTIQTLYQKLESLVENPRMFVDAENYFGPDRRRKISSDYRGPERRSISPPLVRTTTLSRTSRKAG